MPGKKDGRRRLKNHRIKRGLSIRAAAKEIGVTHVGYMPWERGSHSPSAVWRDAIERWSEGDVPAESWPLSEREIREIVRASRATTRIDD